MLLALGQPTSVGDRYHTNEPCHPFAWSHPASRLVSISVKTCSLGRLFWLSETISHLESTTRSDRSCLTRRRSQIRVLSSPPLLNSLDALG